MRSLPRTTCWLISADVPGRKTGLRAPFDTTDATLPGRRNSDIYLSWSSKAPVPTCSPSLCNRKGITTLVAQASHHMAGALSHEGDSKSARHHLCS
jgi:hypothetical protein